MSISNKDLAFLRRESTDRDEWAATPALYFQARQTAFDRVRKETENFAFFEPQKLNVFITVRAPGQPHAQRPTGESAPGPEHEVEISVSMQQLVDKDIKPLPRDIFKIIGAADEPVFYEVKKIDKDQFVGNSQFNIDVKIIVKRLEEPPNALDLPFEDEPVLPKDQ